MTGTVVANGFDDSTIIGKSASAECIPPEPGAWLPGGPLPAALLTGYDSIDQEHRQLLACMTMARAICQDQSCRVDCSPCSMPRRGACENKLVGLLGDLLSFILEHFRHEELVMRDSLLMMVDRDVCQAHMEDHAAISSKIQEIVASIDGVHTVGLLRDLDVLLGNWLSNHILMHDMILTRWVNREDSALRVFSQRNRG